MRISNLVSLIVIGLQDLASREMKINQKMEETFILITGMIVNLICINIIIRVKFCEIIFTAYDKEVLELTYLIYKKFDYFFKSFPAGMHKNCHPRGILCLNRESINFKKVSYKLNVIFAVFNCLKHRMVIGSLFRSIFFF